LYRGAIFLVVSCPCALVISVPLGYFGGIGGAAKRGILVKGGHFLEVLKQANTIVFDKTGTLTKGNFSLDHIEVIDIDEIEALRITAKVESFSNHPIAKAIITHVEGQIDTSDVSNVKEIPGRGLSAKIDNDDVLVGNDALMNDNNIKIKDDAFPGTRIYLAINGSLKSTFYINDEIKSQTIEGLKELKDLGVKRFVMLTGDRKIIANNIANKLGIDEVHAELLPGQKLEVLEDILETDNHVVFVGDGINDAPVLTIADVGVAMGNLGSDVAIESSDIVLMTDEITKVAEGVKVARFTSRIIWQNIILALGIKVLIMILGTVGIANLWTAVFGDVGVAFIAILNSGRAIYSK
jgi:Cd2+/Zn2+-exporting ATPase